MANVDPSVREAYEVSLLFFYYCLLSINLLQAIRKPGSSETWAVFGYEGNKITVSFSYLLM